jgi:Cu-Zn family superoxide dismutase
MIISNAFKTSLFLVFIMTVNYACSEKQNETPTEPSPSPSSTSSIRQQVTAILSPTIGNKAAGSVNFSQQVKGILINAKLTGLTPGAHGFHIHETGDCSSGDGKSAGGHFNPDSVDHGGPDAPTRHIGDLGNIAADDNGNAVYERLDTVVSFSGIHNIIGKGVIVHAGTDDLTSQPTGAADARVACGVITQ